jgi:acetoin utilization protein AcuB
MSIKPTGITAGDIMSRRVVTVEMDDRLVLVKELFEHRKFHHLMVVEDEKLVGILSDRDMLKALSPYIGTQSEADRDTATLNKRVHQVMSYSPITAMVDTDIAEIAKVFTTHMFSCVPILNSHGKPIGVVTWRDLLAALLPQVVEK